MRQKKQINPEVDEHRNHYALIIAILLAYLFAFVAMGVAIYYVAIIFDKLPK